MKEAASLHCSTSAHIPEPDAPSRTVAETLNAEGIQCTDLFREATSVTKPHADNTALDIQVQSSIPEDNNL
jgi:hypothetical protein